MVDAIARGWGRWELDAAIDWHTAQSAESGKSLEELAQPILVAQEDATRSIDWLESRLHTGEVSDQAVAKFAGYLSGPDLRRVITLPRDAKTREDILSQWTSPWSYRDETTPYLAPDVLHSLIEAAGLPATTADRHRARVDQHAHLPTLYTDE